MYTLPYGAGIAQFVQ